MSLRRKRCIRCGAAPVKRNGFSVSCRKCGLVWYMSDKGIEWYEWYDGIMGHGLRDKGFAPFGTLLIFTEEVEV